MRPGLASKVWTKTSSSGEFGGIDQLQSRVEVNAGSHKSQQEWSFLRMFFDLVGSSP